MWANIRRVYSDSWAFALALPVLFLIPPLIEFAQHAVEIQIGFYQPGMSTALAHDPRRMTLGFLKTLGLSLPFYWFVRYMAWGRDSSAARHIEQPAIFLFAFQFTLDGAEQWLALFGPSPGALLGFEGRTGQGVGMGLILAWSVVGVYLTAWSVAWPLGNRAIGPIRSFAVMRGSFWRTLGYMLACALPPMALHYALGYGAIGRPAWLVWGMMAVDALVVGFLGLVAVGAGLVAVEDAARRTGIPVIPRRTQPLSKLVAAD